VARLSGAPAIEIALQLGLGQRESWRAAVDDRPQRRAVAFPEACDDERLSEAVS